MQTRNVSRDPRVESINRSTSTTCRRVLRNWTRTRRQADSRLLVAISIAHAPEVISTSRSFCKALTAANGEKIKSVIRKRQYGAAGRRLADGARTWSIVCDHDSTLRPSSPRFAGRLAVTSCVSSRVSCWILCAAPERASRPRRLHPRPVCGAMQLHSFPFRGQEQKRAPHTKRSAAARLMPSPH